MEINKPYYRKYHSDGVWVFSVPVKDKIEWAVTLTCLSYKVLCTQLEFLISNNTNANDAVENARIDFNKCNPFINKYSFFEKKSLQTLVLELKSLLNQQGEQSELGKVLNALESLKCNALIFTESGVNAYTYTSYDPLSILLSEGSESGKIKNSFMLPEECCQDWKKIALFYGLWKIKVPNDVFKGIWKTVCTEGNFLISLIKHSYHDVIKHLCDSPIMLRKISDLMLNVDPKKLDNEGFSAFYHGLFTEDSDLCIKLYHLAIFFTTDEENEANLEHLYNVIRRDYQSVKSTYLARNLDITKIYHISESLTSLIEIKREIKHAVLKNKSSFDQMIENYDAKLQRQTMLDILAVYRKIINGTGKDIEISDLDYYIFYKYFFDEVDIEVSLFFLYNIYMLKSKLKLENEYEYASIESAFFISVLNYVIFNRKVKISDYFRELSEISVQSSHRIFYDVRNAVLSKVELFRDVLKNTAVDDSNIRQEVPANEYYLLLYSHPEIKEYLLVKRLTNYIESTLKETEATFSLKSVFVIERTLQVLSEYMKLEQDSDSAFKWLLFLYMTKDVREVLYHLRDYLTHSKTNAFARKIRAERDFSLFKRMKDDISNIYKYLKPLLRALLHKTVIYVKKKLEESINSMECSEDYERSFKNTVSAIVKNLLDVSDSVFVLSEDDLIFIFKSLLGNLYFKFKEEKSKLSESKVINMKKLLTPLGFVMALALDNHAFNENSSLQKLLLDYETCRNLNDTEQIIQNVELLMTKCEQFIAQWNTTQEFDILDDIPNIKRFLLILKNLCYMEEKDRNEIREHVKENGKEDLEKRAKIELSVNKGFTMNYDELSKNKIAYLSNTKWRMLKECYKNKDKNIDKIINLPDPMTEIENVFISSSIKHKDFERLCKKNQSS